MTCEEMRDRIQATLNESEDYCARCQHCDRQLDAVMAVVWPEVERLQALTAECSCGATYETYGGPEPDCAVHGAVQALNEAQAKVAEYENAITWETSCLACSATLDASYAETVRAEKAEAGLKALTDVIARYDDQPGDAYIPIGVLRLALPERERT